MELVQLTADYEIKPFDCGDPVLNGFLCENAKPFMENRLAKTYLFCEGNQIVGYFCLLNDKLSRQEVANNDWRKIKKLFPHTKHMRSYPAVKIGRFAISIHRPRSPASYSARASRNRAESAGSVSRKKFSTPPHLSNSGALRRLFRRGAIVRAMWASVEKVVSIGCRGLMVNFLTKLILSGGKTNIYCYFREMI